MLFWKKLYYKRNNDLVYAHLDGDICIFEENNCKYFNLNKTGTFIWDYLESPRTIEEIVNEINKVFYVEKSSCLLEVKSFLRDGIEKNVIIKLKND